MKRFYIILFISLTLFSKSINSLEYALKTKIFKPKDSVVITNPSIKPIKPKINRENFDLDTFLFLSKIKRPTHPLNQGLMLFKKKQTKIEKKISKDIKKIFFIPKKIKVKSALKKDKVYTQFIYTFDE